MSCSDEYLIQSGDKASEWGYIREIETEKVRDRGEKQN